MLILEIVFHTYLYKRRASALTQKARRLSYEMQGFCFLPDVPQFFRGLYRHLLPDKASTHLVVESNASPVPVSGQHTVATSIRFSGTEISEYVEAQAKKKLC